MKFALKQVDYLYVVVGSAQKSHQRDNPFTAGERISMIKSALDGNGVDPSRWMSIPIADADSHSVWVSSVESMLPKFDVVFTNDALTFLLFKEQGIEVKSVPFLDRRRLSATNVRDRILERKDWESLVPTQVARLVVKFGGMERVSELRRKDIPGGKDE
ncbi:MAG: nicotinamide-nucleotide adenylyltransferase [Nitrososphaerales archaeon]|nr:nicotinamide-nucleotide adenylyltransferase [Nitrososphaerales archaeon]